MMAICLHPSSSDPVRYRVYDRSLGIRVDFSFTKFGRLGAERAAKQYEANVVLPKLKMAKLIDQLPTNQIFDINGMVAGLDRRFRLLENGNKIEILFFRKRINGVYRRAEVSLSKPTFEEAYKAMQVKILKLHDVECSKDISKMFKAAKRFYW